METDYGITAQRNSSAQFNERHVETQGDLDLQALGKQTDDCKRHP